MDPFAQALKSNSASNTRSAQNTKNLSPEVETNLNSATKNGTNAPTENPFAQAMARAGGVKGGVGNGENFSAQDLERQKKSWKRNKRKKL